MSSEPKAKIEYKKKPKILDDQIKKLQERGLLISDRDFALKKLKHINYYDLSAYFKFYQDKDNAFKIGTRFEDVVNIFNFDIRLRLFLLNYLGQIEKSFKCIMTYEMAVKSDDSHWYYNRSMYTNDICHVEMSQHLIDEARKAEAGRNEAVMHYYETYHTPVDPPIWTLIDILSFGKAVLLYKKLSDENRRLIAVQYDFQSISVFYNWILALSKLRNNCAHHLRVWNNTVSIAIMSRVPEYKNLFNNKSNHRLYNYLVVLQILLNKIRETSGLKNGLAQLIADHNISCRNMGFPEDWDFRFGKIIEIENGKRADRLKK